MTLNYFIFLMSWTAMKYAWIVKGFCFVYLFVITKYHWSSMMVLHHIKTNFERLQYFVLAVFKICRSSIIYKILHTNYTSHLYEFENIWNNKSLFLVNSTQHKTVLTCFYKIIFQHFVITTSAHPNVFVNDIKLLHMSKHVH